MGHYTSNQFKIVDREHTICVIETILHTTNHGILCYNMFTWFFINTSLLSVPLSLQGMSACLASTILEWIISFLTCIYVATFTPEFKYFELIKAKILFHEMTRNNEVPGNENSETQSNGTVVTTTFTETSAKY